MSHAKDAYWPAIDGLRAIAILLVVTFHAGVPQISGGFLGVDIFFVISGFLITGLLVREFAATGRIDILNFFGRRTRRLLPALAVVLLLTLCAAAVLLVPVGQQQNLAQSAIAASGFAANVYFWRGQSNYFASTAEELPLLHLWTLAVEEQFYIVWPITMVAVAVVARRWAREARPWIIVVLIGGSAVSFLASCWFALSHVTATFYMTPFRAWEFGLGALLALAFRGIAGRKEKAAMSSAGGVLVAVGLAAVFVAAISLSGNTFPGVAAVLPVLGTATIIAGIQLDASAAPVRFLASAPMVAIGKLSYSWYLWHWPLLALVRASVPGQASIMRDIGLVLVALVLSALTFRYVEEPVRRRRPGPFASSATSVAAGGGLMAATACFAALLWAGADWRVGRDPVLQAAETALSEKADLSAACMNFRLPFTGLAPDEACTLGNGDVGPFVLLWGDSHAHHYIPGLVQWAEEHAGRLLPRTMGGCQPQIRKVDAETSGVARLVAESCAAFNAAVRATLPSLGKSGVSQVILAAQWPVAAKYRHDFGDWKADLRVLLEELIALGFEPIIFADVPLPGSFVPYCVARAGAQGCERPRADVDAERASTLAILRSLTDEIHGLRVFDPIDELCRFDKCLAMLDGRVLYSDASHLAVAASRMLAPAIAAALVSPAQVPR